MLPSLKLLFEIEENSMSRMKRGSTIASTLLLVAMLISACEQPYSTPPVVTNTPIDPNSFFSTPIASQPTSMQDVENITTLTAIAAEATPTPIISGTEAPGSATLTPTSIIGIVPTATQAVASVPTSTSAPVGSRPTTYTLKKGEFPYCIARRYNVDPEALLRLSGLSSGVLYPPGTVLTLPQSGTFPEERTLRSHPTTYTVTSADETVYGVACLFGDIEPLTIAQHNNISVDAALTVGQTLNIP
ncbi:LysM peptidoglycan-binding domain-containing protein [Chloroflexi bacterium CFX6]|nr:LysM peptidoglycan-binding domain-containing protein [Chloroflexi bacterium CFX6]